MIAPMALLTIAISITTFTNMQELIDFTEAYRYYALPFALLIPVILWIKAELRHRNPAKQVRNGPT